MFLAESHVCPALGHFEGHLTMATIERRAGKESITYRVKIRRRGATPLTATFPTRHDAHVWALQEEAKVLIHGTKSAHHSHTVGEAVDRYLATIVPQKAKTSQRAHVIHLTRWKERIGHKRLSEVPAAFFYEWRDTLIAQGLQNTTINRYTAIMRHLFSVCVEWEWLDVSPLRRIKDLKEHDGRTRYLTQEECARLLAACQISQNARLYMLVVLALATGARKSELLHLRYRDVNVTANLVTFVETKNGRTRSVPLTGTALAAMHDYGRKYPHTPDDLVFPRVSDPSLPMTFREAWESTLRRAGLKGAVFHTIRHTTASHLMMSGASLVDVATILGHQQISQTRRYSHLSPSHIQGVMERMTKRLF